MEVFTALALGRGLGREGLSPVEPRQMGDRARIKWAASLMGFLTSSGGKKAGGRASSSRLMKQFGFGVLASAWGWVGRWGRSCHSFDCGSTTRWMMTRHSREQMGIWIITEGSCVHEGMSKGMSKEAEMANRRPKCRCLGCGNLRLPNKQRNRR